MEQPVKGQPVKGQPVKGQPVTITLYVSAEDLYNVKPQPPNEPQDELDAYCILGDNNDIKRGKPNDGGNLNSFTSQVYSGDKVTWVGQNIKNDGYQVSIVEISNDTGFFPTSLLTGSGGRVTGTPNLGIKGKEDTYSILFSISRPGQGDPNIYQLDPKLGGNDGEEE